MTHPAMRRLPLLALPFLLALAACRPSETTDEPPESIQETPLEAAVTTDSLAGTYRLWQVDEAPLPGAVGYVDECAVELTEGHLDLKADATYTLDVLARAVCDPDEEAGAEMVDRAMSEGPYTVEGFEVRFGPDVTRIHEEDAEGEDEPDLFNTAAFAGTGALRDTVLTVRLTDDLTTLTFVRE